ncbi:MAG: hypothetical protein ACRDU4_07865, partial [Mycobacterium sp.]
YDEVVKLMGFSPRGKGAPGGVFHWVTKTESGVRVTDVWESREDFEKFAKEQIGPYGQTVGLPNPPVITFHEVHNYLTAG